MIRNAAEEEDPMATMEFKIVAGVLGAAATFVAQKLISRGWTTITGQEPPDPDDPDAPAVSAVAWVAASAVGAAVVQVLVRRFAAKRYSGLGRRPARR